MQTDLITKVYFNEHLTHSCVGMPQGLQALLSSYYISLLINMHSIYNYYISLLINMHSIYNYYISLLINMHSIY